MLETTMEALTKAVVELTAVMKKGGAAPAAAPKKGPGRPPKATAAAEPAKLTVAQVRKIASDLVNREKAKDAQKRITDTIRPVAAALGVAALKDITEEQCEEAKGFLDQLVAAYDEGGIEGVEAVQIGDEAQEESPL